MFDRELLKLIPNYDPFKCDEKFFFDDEAAGHVIHFFETYLYLTTSHSKFVLQPWQKGLLANLYGWKWKDPDRGNIIVDRYKTAFIEEPRGSGKTELAAGIQLYELCARRDNNNKALKVQNPICICAAGSIKQSDELFKKCYSMVARSQKLKSVLKLGAHSISNPKRLGTLTKISSDGANAHGLSPTCCVIDEMASAKKEAFIEALLTSRGKRLNSKFVMISTAAPEGVSIMNTQEEYALKVRSGEINDPHYLPVIHRLEKDEDWELESNWFKASPNLGVSFSIADLRQEYIKAKNMPSFRNSFRRLYLNQKVSAVSSWLDLSDWNALNKPIPDEMLWASPCFGGYDGSSTRDSSAFALYFPNEKVFRVWTWVPQETADAATHSSKWHEWENDPLSNVQITAGNFQQTDTIKREILNIIDRYMGFQKLAYDRAYAGEIVKYLFDNGVQIDPFGQGYLSLSQPCKELERLILAKDVNFLNNNCVKWGLTNCNVKMDDQENIKIIKKTNSGRIDMIMACIMALGEYMADDDFGYEANGKVMVF